MKPSTGVLLGALVVAAIGLGVAWKLLAAAEAPAPAPAPEARREAAQLPPAPDLDPQRAPSDRSAAAEGAAPAIEPAETHPARTEPTDPPVHVRGRVLDARGTPIPAVAVGVEGKSDALATSDAFGTFEFDLDHGGRRIVSKSQEWITVRYDQLDAQEEDREHFVIVAPPISIAGKVVDPDARAIAGAVVAVRLPITTFAAFPFALDSTGVIAPSTKTGADGAFVLERVPSLARADLETSAPGFADDQRPLPTESATDLLIEMREPEVTGAVLEGVVVHEDGSPAPDAVVHLAGEQAKTDERGNFRLEIGPVDENAALVATKKGFQAAVLPEYGRAVAATDGHPPPARLVLGGKPLTIAGHVLEADGVPCPGWTVALAQGTAVSQFRIPVITAEELTTGKEIQATTDKQGAFALEGLRDMTYVLQAWGRDGRMIRSDPVQAGTPDAELRCEPDAYLERIRGRVVSRDGLPLAGLDVTVSLVTFDTSFGSSWFTVKSATTKDDGTFTIERIPKRFTRLTVDGESIQTTSRSIAEIDLDRPVEIAVVRTCRFRFESAPGQEVADWLVVLDAQGTTLSLVTRDAKSMMTGSSAQLTDGHSHVLSVSEDAARLVLYKAGAVLSSQPVRLVPGEIVTVHGER
jgi:protocatechuate 3,4-dioxygenase beta subunit